MKTIQNKTLGLVIALVVPSTLDECIQIFGSAEVVVDTVVSQETFHGWNTVFASKFCDALEKESKVVRPVIKETPSAKKDAPTIKQYESPLKYCKRVLNNGFDKARFNELGQQIAATIKFAEGGGSVGRIGKTFLDTAEAILNLEDVEIEQVVNNLKSFNEGLVIENDEDGRPLKESLARALKVDQVQQETARKARLGITNLPKVEKAEESKEGDAANDEANAEEQQA